MASDLNSVTGQVTFRGSPPTICFRILICEMGFWLGSVHRDKRCEDTNWKHVLWWHRRRLKSAVIDEKAILKESPKGPKEVIVSYHIKAFSLKCIKHSRLASCTPGLTGTPRNSQSVPSCRKASGDHEQVVTSVGNSIFPICKTRVSDSLTLKLLWRISHKWQ